MPLPERPWLWGSTPTAVALRLRQSREWAGRSQSDLALRLEMTRQNVAYLESARGNVTVRQLMGWAEVCAVDPLWLLCGFSDPRAAGPQRALEAAGFCRVEFPPAPPPPAEGAAPTKGRKKR